MISPETLVLFLLATTLVIVGIGARLISDARRQRRHRRWAHDVVDTPAIPDEHFEQPPASKPHVAAPVLEMPIRQTEDESVARTTAAVEEQAFEAARQSLTRIAGQTEALLAMPDVRRHERVDMTVRGLAAESGWLLQL